MSANAAPRFVDPGRTWFGQVSAANTNLDGSGTVVTIVTAGSNGSLIELIRVKAIVTTTAGMVRIFLNDGTSTRLYKEISVTAATPSGTVQAFEAEYEPTDPLILPSGWSLRASTHNAETFNIIVTGGDY
jgi:hypothetical protein